MEYEMQMNKTGEQNTSKTHETHHIEWNTKQQQQQMAKTKAVLRR